MLCALYLLCPLLLCNVSCVNAAVAKPSNKMKANDIKLASENNDVEDDELMDEENLEEMLEQLGSEMAKPKIGYCNFELMFQTPVFDEIKAMSNEIESRLKPKSDSISSESEKLNKDYTDYEKKKSTMSMEKRDEVKADLDNRNLIFTKKVQDFQMEMNEATGNLSRRALEIASDVVKILCQDEKKYDIIIPSPFMCNEEYNITQEIIDRANAKYKEKSKAIVNKNGSKTDMKKTK